MCVVKPGRSSQRVANNKHRWLWVPAFAGTTVGYTTVLWRSMQVRSTSSMDLPHQSLEKISISE